MGWWGVVALLREIVGNPYEAKKAAPNPTLQQTGHAIQGFMEFSASLRVSRLLSLLFGHRRARCRRVPHAR